MALLNVGMPGVGLGGIFYLAGALAMPFVELARSVRARLGGTTRPAAERRWRLALTQASIALAVLGTGWLVGLAIARWRPTSVARASDGVATAASASPLRWSTLALGVALLIVVLGAVELLRLVVARRDLRPSPIESDVRAKRSAA